MARALATMEFPQGSATIRPGDYEKSAENPATIATISDYQTKILRKMSATISDSDTDPGAKKSRKNRGSKISGKPEEKPGKIGKSQKNGKMPGE